MSAQCSHAERWEAGVRGLGAAAQLLLEFWQAQVTNEDAFRALVDLLGKQERFQLAEECYRQHCAALDRDGHQPHSRTQEAMEVLRATRLRRESRRPQPALASSSPGSLEADQMGAHRDEKSGQRGTSATGESEAPAERLVAETRHLIGREAWLRGVCQMVQAFPAKKLVILQGPIGVGKSSELTRLADSFQRTSSGVIWLPFPAEWSSGPEAALDLLLGMWLGACGVASSAAETSRERLIGALLAHLKQQRRPTVVLLDNAECLLEANGTLAPCWEAFLVQFVRSLHQATVFLATKEWRGWPGRDSIFVAETFVPPLSLEESVCLLLKAHGLTWKRDVSARIIEDDKRRFPLKDISYSSAEVPIDLDALSITNNKRVLAASIFADVSGFTKYIDAAQSAQEKITALRVLHAVRKELARVIKYDFGGLRIQYQGDRVQGLFHLPQDNEAAIAKKAVETAVGLQSSMEQTLKACLPEANTLRLAVGVDMGITLVSKLGARSQRDRICLGEAVEDAAKYEEHCVGGQIGVSKRIHDALPDCLRNHFTYSIAARCFVATDLTVDKVERATQGVQRYQGGRPVYIQTGAAGVRISSQELPNARQTIPSRPYAPET